MNANSRENLLLPALFTEKKFNPQPITDADAFASRAGRLFAQDPELSRAFASQVVAQMESKRREDMRFSAVGKDPTAFAEGAVSQVITNFQYGTNSEDRTYRYEMYYKENPPISEENYQRLQSLIEVAPVVRQEKMLFGRIRLPQGKETPDSRIIYGTNPSEDMIVVNTEVRFHWEETKLSIFGKPEAVRKLAWIHRYAAYRNTPDGVVSLGDPLTIGSMQYGDVDYLIEDTLDLGAIAESPEDVKVHIIIPKNMIVAPEGKK